MLTVEIEVPVFKARKTQSNTSAEYLRAALTLVFSLRFCLIALSFAADAIFAVSIHTIRNVVVCFFLFPIQVLHVFLSLINKSINKLTQYSLVFYYFLRLGCHLIDH
jgi:hypothetical protein